MEYILKGKEKIERSVISKRRDSRMDVKRVKQILSSSSRIDVTYEGVPVWIESCDEQSGVAQVYDVSNPRKRSRERDGFRGEVIEKTLLIFRSVFLFIPSYVQFS